jgi:hypothetical protein
MYALWNGPPISQRGVLLVRNRTLAALCLLIVLAVWPSSAAAQKSEGPPPPPPAVAAKVVSVSVIALNQSVPEKDYLTDRYKVVVRNDSALGAVYFYVWGENASAMFSPVVITSTAARYDAYVGWWLALAPGQSSVVSFTARSAGTQRYCASGEKVPTCGTAPA